MFNRLGPGAIKRAATSTSMLGSDSECEEEGTALEYAGVLKPGAPRPKKKKFIEKITIVKPMPSTAAKPNLRMHIEQRLGGY